MPDDDLRALIDSVVAEARRLATRADGTVDTYREALEFRRLLVEAAAQDPE